MESFKDYLDEVIKGEKIEEMAAGYTSEEFLKGLFDAVANGKITPKQAMNAVRKEKNQPSIRDRKEMKAREDYAKQTGGGCLY